MRAGEIVGRPVVTLAGDALADVKDVLYDAGHGVVVGFTLNKRGRFAGPMKAVLPFDALLAVGRDAVMVASDEALHPQGDPVAEAASAAAGRNVVGDEVLTDAGRRLGRVTDLVVELPSGSVVGYQLKGDEALQAHAGETVLIPLPNTLAVSSSTLVVPGSVEGFVRDDLTGFGGAVADFRARLGGQS